MTLGEKLSRLRRENNYTQEQLADILNVSRQSISKWESDVAYPETDKIIRLCELFHCSMDYLLRENIQERNDQAPPRSKEPSKAVKVLLGILRFTPMALFSLWALLLWAFYAAPLVGITGGSLYHWFNSGLVFELQPTMRALVSLGVIACAYIVPLVCLQFFANKKVNFIVSICSVVFHVAIFVCSLCLVSISVGVGLGVSPVGIVVAVLTAVFAQVQTAAVLMNYFFNGIRKELRAASVTKPERKTSNWLKLHKALAIVLACVLFVGIVLSIVLPLTVGNVFKASRVSRIQLGDSRDQVVKVLGKPIDVDTDKLAEIVGEENVSAISNESVYYYCSKNAEKLIKNILRLLDEVENLVSVSPDEADVLFEKIHRLQEQLYTIEFSYIEVSFELGAVVGVEFNSKFNAARENDVKWNVKGDKRQKLTVIPGEIPYGETPYSAELYAQIFYADGSYKLSRIQNVTAAGNAEKGWTMEWSDSWGKYFRSIKEGADTGNIVERGEWDNNVNYIITNASKTGMEGYTLKILANSNSVDASTVQFNFDAYRNEIVEVIVSNAITNLPDGIFANLPNLISAKLSSRLSKIGASTFQGCSKLKSVNIASSITSIGAHAFDGCGFVEINIPYQINTIGDYAFANCLLLSNVDWHAYVTHYYRNLIGKNIFNNTPNLTTVSISTDYIPDGLFKGCTNLQTVNIGDVVSDIGQEVFRNCTSLTHIDMKNAYCFYENVFAGCSNLVSVTLGYTDWIVTLDGPIPKQFIFSVNSPEEAALLLTTTYCNYKWVSDG